MSIFLSILHLTDTSSGRGPGPPNNSDQSRTQPILPGQITGSSAWYGDRASGGNPMHAMRSFAQIVEDEKRDRNILEISIQKPKPSDDDPEAARIKPITFDDLGELIFDVLKINASDCLSFDYNTGRYDCRQIKFKPGISLDPYVTTTPISFKDHLVTTQKQLNNIVRVTFKNVPLNVPNEEIINLCNCYGKPVDNKVTYETLTNARNKGHTGSTRYVDMEFQPNVSMENYYWMEGPLQGDKGRRILVLHNGQESQCSNCLRKGSSGCPALGNGRLCVEMKTPRGKMNIYMNSLKVKVGYSSLKTKYMEMQARHFPSLQGTDSLIPTMEEDPESNIEIFPTNPVEEKDKEIHELKKELDEAKTTVSEINNLKETVTKLSAELKISKTKQRVSNKKLEFTKNATEQLLVDNIMSDGYNGAENIIIGAYSATLDEDEIDLEVDSNDSEEARSRKDIFLSMKSKLNLDDENQSARFNEVKNLVLEKVKHTKNSRIRSRSGCSVFSNGSIKRSRSRGEEDVRQPSQRPKSSIPSLKK